jgi:hypothetical protein
MRRSTLRAIAAAVTVVGATLLFAVVLSRPGRWGGSGASSAALRQRRVASDKFSARRSDSLTSPATIDIHFDNDDDVVDGNTFSSDDLVDSESGGVGVDTELATSATTRVEDKKRRRRIIDAGGVIVNDDTLATGGNESSNEISNVKAAVSADANDSVVAAPNDQSGVAIVAGDAATNTTAAVIASSSEPDVSGVETALFSTILASPRSWPYFRYFFAHYGATHGIASTRVFVTLHHLQPIKQLGDTQGATLTTLLSFDTAATLLPKSDDIDVNDAIVDATANVAVIQAAAASHLPVDLLDTARRLAAHGVPLANMRVLHGAW